MKSIEEIKIELTLKMLAGKISYLDIKDLPIDDELRTFVCSIGPFYARYYAQYVEAAPNNETREAACKDPESACAYAEYIDCRPGNDTRKAACGDAFEAYWYAIKVDKCPREDTRKVAYQSSKWKERYIEEFGE
jgi:hypothetical protein